VKKIGLICLAVVLSLGAMGAALAYWSDTLTINGSVTTGTFDTNFTAATCTDNEGTGPDVGTCGVTDTLPAKSFTVTIGNGYPCYQCTVNYTITNSGTIPAKIKSITIGGVPVTHAGDYVDIDLNPTTNKDIRVTVTAISVGDAIAANGGTLSGDLEIHVIENSVEGLGYDADENASGDFTVTIETTQFNAP